MFKIKTPASTSNLGCGFDSLGLAFDIYNNFSIEESDVTILEGIDEAFNNDNNLFLKAYRKACNDIGKEKPIHVIFDCDIPISRGLGSSSTFVVAGLYAAYLLNDINLPDKEEIFNMACEFEGHPDNVAPCIYGGFLASTKVSEDTFITRNISLSKEYKFTCLIPDFEISTEKARSLMPTSYPIKIVYNSLSKAILTTKAFESGDLDLLKIVNKDEIHEPYRKELIKDFSNLSMLLNKNTDGLLLISGSGSTCLYISKEEIDNNIDLSSLNNKWLIKTVSVDYNGTIIEVKDE